MHFVLAGFLVLFAGWTLAVHVCVLAGWGLQTLWIVFPVMLAVLSGIYGWVLRVGAPESRGATAATPGQRSMGSDAGTGGLLACVMTTRFTGVLSSPAGWGAVLRVSAVVLATAALYLSWTVFWALSICMLLLCLCRVRGAQGTNGVTMGADDVPSGGGGISAKQGMLIIGCCVLWMLLSHVLIRGDLDDSFYAAVAAFAASHPELPLHSVDPMLGEPAFPLIFSSYRFSSFELLSGALAYLMSVPAMDVYYLYLLPIWSAISVLVVFLLTGQLSRNGLTAGVMVLLLVLLLGEMHRSPANFNLVRLYQGKAVFVSVLVPGIFYLTARLFSRNGGRAEVFLLACCQISAIGLSNFGMLMGPLATVGAWLSNLPAARDDARWKSVGCLAVTMLAVPCLTMVALQSEGSPLRDFPNEAPEDIWRTVFGTRQQYWVGLLLLAGPLMTRDPVLRWRLAVPVLLLLGVYLNPWLAGFISEYVTTPPVYWRVVWSFPVLIFLGVSLTEVLRWMRRERSRVARSILGLAMVLVTIHALPLHTLRSGNINFYALGAVWKVPAQHLDVARTAIGLSEGRGRLLAPDEISGVISRFEQHPVLIQTRYGYLDLMRPGIEKRQYTLRRLLMDFLKERGADDLSGVGEALRALGVSTLVTHDLSGNPSLMSWLQTQGYRLHVSQHGYQIWGRSE